MNSNRAPAIGPAGGITEVSQVRYRAAGTLAGECALEVAMKAVLFDLGDTLIRLHPLAGRMAADGAKLIEARAGLAPEDANALGRQLVQRLEEDNLRASEAGGAFELDPVQLMTEGLVGAGVGVSPGLAAELADLIGHEDVARFEHDPRCVAEVERLKAEGYRLAIVSNTLTRPGLLDAYLGRIGLLHLFVARVYSVEIGRRKPDPGIYAEALKRLGCEPKDAVFIGDRVREDVLGPQAVGIRGVLTHEFRQEDPGPSPPFAVVRDIAGLRALLS
ncbi:MAG: HAD family hydrolase [Chloroflexi bacterium]|nr:HAD family hydrolase [Chloroflexota bacterium]